MPATLLAAPATGAVHSRAETAYGVGIFSVG